MVVISKNPVHSELWLILVFFCISGHYILLNAQFLAIVNFIVYMGAIMVLILFSMMFLNLSKDAEPHKTTLVKFAGVISAGLLMVVMFSALKQTVGGDEIKNITQTDIGLVKNLGKTLFKDFLLPFEIVSILLLTAMVGSVLLAKKEIN